MKKIMFILPVLFFFNFAIAQMTSAEQNTLKQQEIAQAKANKLNAEAAAAVSSYGTGISNWGSKVAAGLGSTYTSAKNGVMNFGTKVFSSSEDLMNPDSDAQKKIIDRTQEANRAKLQVEDKREKASESTTSALEAAGSVLTAAKTSITTNTSAAFNSAMSSASDTALAAYIKSVGLTASFSSLSNRYNSINDAMIALERNLDRSVMAAYMQEKIRKMMSSDVLCKAAASCQKNGKNTAAISTADMKSIFPLSTTEASKAATAPDTAAAAKANK